MMASGTLRELLGQELQDLYSAEQNIIRALPELVSAATSRELKAALDTHLQRTKVHAERLDLIFKQSSLGAATQPSGIESIIKAGAERVKTVNGDVRDAAIIAAAQHVEHYEMAGYGCARTWARQLGDDRSADLLQQTLDEEGDADKQLTDLAQSGINASASAGAESRRRDGARLRYVDVDDLASDQYRDVKIRNRAGDDLGTVDGFVVDASGRPYYLVVDSGGVFVGRRYVVPIGRAESSRKDRAFTVDLDKDTLKRYPEFHRDAFMAMTDEEARRYEWRVLEAIDPQAARTSTREWDYDQYPYYQQPDWFDRNIVTSTGRSTVPKGTSRSREVPFVEHNERERVIAREEREGRETPSERDRVRGRGPDER
jgi:ferritin-like metal-binding protein YciE